MPISIDMSGLPKLTNRAFYPLYRDKARYHVLMGGGGSGKSEHAASQAMRWMLEGRNERILFCRKVAKTIRNSQFHLFRTWVERCNLSKLFDFSKTDLEVKCKNGNVIICSGLDDQEKIKSITGITKAWIEEATDLTLADFSQVDLRVRQDNGSPNQILLTFNPITANHWLNRRFFIKGDSAARVHVSTYRDNRWASQQYRDVLEGLREQNPVLYGIYANAQWGVLQGLIYGPFPELPGPIRAEYPQRFCGLDFGFTNPTALVRCNVDADGQIVLQEMVYERGLTTEDLITHLNKTEFPRTEIIWADAAEPDRIETMQRAGYAVLPCWKGRVRDGIDFVKTFKIFTIPENENINKEAETYSWAVDKKGNNLDEPTKFSDHAMDAIRYAITSQFRPQNQGGVVVYDLMDEFSDSLVSPLY